ncbi:7439_t:CDS:2, partial [Racocetra fulgida]
MHCYYSPESFKYKGKTYKTCANCLTSKAENLISNIENNGKISFEICVDLTDDIFSEVESNNLKSIAKIIVNKVEEGDDYVWSTETASRISARFNNIAIYYFVCSQCNELEREYKQSNQKRITRFECYGKLNLHIDVPAIEAILKLRHDVLYEKPENVSMPEKIKQEIHINLHLDPIQI